MRCPGCGKLVLVHDDGTLATHLARYRPGFERPRECPAAGRKVMGPLPGSAKVKESR